MVDRLVERLPNLGATGPWFPSLVQCCHVTIQMSYLCHLGLEAHA